MEEKLTKLMPIVATLAVAYYKKMRRPNMHDIDDLISEGKLVVIKELSKNREVVQAYVIQCVRNHFKVLLNQTYKDHGSYFYLEEGNQGHLDEHVVSPDTLEVDILDVLTDEQKTYIALAINIPATYKDTIGIIRGLLELEPSQERRIRRSLLALA